MAADHRVDRFIRSEAEFKRPPRMEVARASLAPMKPAAPVTTTLMP
jgi:hypothetical protein